MATKPKIGPPGSTNTQNIPVMKNNMVSLPTLTSFTGYWSYTATKTGYVIFDALLSTTANQDQDNLQPAVAISGVPVRQSLSVDEFGELINPNLRYAQLCYVTKGETYTVSLTPFNNAGAPVNLVLRISEFSTERDVQVPDLTFTISYGSAFDLDPNTRWNHNDSVFPQSNIDPGGAQATWRQDASGHGKVDKALGGTTPGDMSGGITCAWQRARKMAGSAFDGFFWGANPDGATLDERVRWQGLSICQLPYKPTGGAGYNGSWSSPLGTGGIGNAGTVGFSYSANGDSTFALGLGGADFYIYHLTARVSFEDAQRTLAHEAIYWLRDNIDQGLNGTGYEAEAGTEKDPGNVVAFSWAADEANNGGASVASYGAPIRTNIYTAVGYGGGNASGNSDTWSDYDWMTVNFPLSAGETSRWWPNSLEGTRRANHDNRVPIELWSGGYMDWVEIPRDMIEEAKLDRRGLWFSMIPDGTSLGTPAISPGALMPLNNGPSATYVRNNQALCSRFTAEYPHFHVIDYPAYPDSTMLGIGGGPTDAQRYFVGRK